MELLERTSFLPTLAEYAGEARQGDGRLVLVSGESGMGKTALLEAFQRRTKGARWLWGACDGLDVIVHGRDAARGAETVEAIKLVGGCARFAAADLSEPAGIERLAAEAGDVDFLVNNAGLSSPRRRPATSPAPS
jgi:NAD(P)-dependent dehydrogenase (short-subunit alcohol dehydrogenase family)